VAVVGRAGKRNMARPGAEDEEEINRCGLMIAKCCGACGYWLLAPL